MTTQLQIQAWNTAAIEKAVSGLPEINYDSVSKKISEMIVRRELVLDPKAYIPANKNDPHGVGRYLVYRHNDPTNPVSIWAFSFAPRQKTSIHSHKYKGTVIVLKGRVTEKFYRLTEDGRVTLLSRNARSELDINRDEPNKGTIHQLKFCKEEAETNTNAVTMHIYGMRDREDNQSQDNRNLHRLFTKKPQTVGDKYSQLLRSKL